MSLLVQAEGSLANDFGEPMAVLFQVPVTNLRLAAWRETLDAVRGGSLAHLAAPFLSQPDTDAPASILVESADGAFQALPKPGEARRLFGEWGGGGFLWFRLFARDPGFHGLDLLVPTVTLRMDNQGVRWAAGLSDVEEARTLTTPPLDPVHILELELQLSEPRFHPRLFAEIIERDPRRATFLLAHGVPDPWATETFRIRPLQDLPTDILKPLVEHPDPDIRMRAENAVLFPPAP